MTTTTAPGQRLFEVPRVPITLRGTPLFRDLPSTVLDSLAHFSHRHTIARGDTVFEAGHHPQQLTIMVRGLVKVVRDQPGGSQATVGLFGPRDAVGLAAVLEQRPYPGTALALTRHVELISIRTRAFLDATREHPALALAVNRALLDHTHLLRTTIDVLSAGSVEQRLAALFTSLLERFGDETDDGITVLRLTLSRGELAALVGARSETTIRVLSSWHKRRVLDTTSDGFVLVDAHALRRLRAGLPSE